MVQHIVKQISLSKISLVTKITKSESIDMYIMCLTIKLPRHLQHISSDPNMKPGQETLCNHLVLFVLLGPSWLSETLPWHLL